MISFWRKISTLKEFKYILLQNWLIFQCDTINKAATNIAKTVAKEHGTITAGGIAMTDVYQTTRNKEKTVAELKTSTKALIDSDIDMLICEVMYLLKFLFRLVSIHKLKNFEFWSHG